VHPFPSAAEWGFFYHHDVTARVASGIVLVLAGGTHSRVPLPARSPLFTVLFLLLSMKGETKERWQEVCEQAAIEKDTEKLLKLVAEINRLLHEKLSRLEGKSTNP